MSTRDSSIQPRSGLLTALDVIIAPQAAFERLALAPTWAWAFLLTAAVGIATNFVILPAVLHALDASLPAQLLQNHAVQSLPSDKQQTQIAASLSFAHTFANFNWVIAPFAILLVVLVQTVVLLIVNAAAKGKGNFRRLWALAMNVGVVGFGISYLVTALVVLVRGPAAFDSTIALQNAVPGLGSFVPSSAPVLAAFLGPFTLVNLWAAALFVAGLRVIAGIGTTSAVIAVAVMLLGQGLVSAIGPALQH